MGWGPKCAAAAPVRVTLIFEKTTVLPPTISIVAVEGVPNGGGKFPFAVILIGPVTSKP